MLIQTVNIMIQKPSRSQLTDSWSFGLLINGHPCQFESLRDPFVVMFSVPFALVGVILMLFFTNTTLNLQSFIGWHYVGWNCSEQCNPAGWPHQSFTPGGRHGPATGHRVSGSETFTSYFDDSLDDQFVPDSSRSGYGQRRWSPGTHGPRGYRRIAQFYVDYANSCSGGLFDLRMEKRQKFRWRGSKSRRIGTWV